MNVKTPLLLALAASLLALAGCPPKKPRTISVRDVSRASGAPEISGIVDLGRRGIIKEAVFEIAGGDGHGVVGEVLLIQGDNFGKQPTTTIGDQPATFLGHVSTGGILVRVPWGIDAGKVKVEVANHRGRSSTTYVIKRVVVVTDAPRGNVPSITIAK